MIVAPPDSGTALPSHEVLGELFLEMKRPQEALREFEAALRRTPGRLRSLHGLAKASALAGNRPAAETYYKALLEHLSHADADLPELAEARQYLMSRE
jgi:tetratricopeptide (TPR) repeat protein